MTGLSLLTFAMLGLVVVVGADHLPSPIVISLTCGSGCASSSFFDVSVSGGPVQSSPALSFSRGNLYVLQVDTPGHAVALHTLPGQIDTGYRFDQGVQNNGVDHGMLVFLVPNNAPAVLYYQSESAFALFGRINVIGGPVNATVPNEPPTPIPAPPAPAADIPSRFWTPICSGAVSSADGSNSAASPADDGPAPASPEVNPGRTQEDIQAEEELQERRARWRKERTRRQTSFGPALRAVDDKAPFPGVERGLGTQQYSCTTSTRAEQLMDLCLSTLVRESSAASETCLTEGPGIFTPVSSSRMLMACGVAAFNAWSVFDQRAVALGPAKSLPKKHTGSRFRTKRNKEVAMTFAVYQAIKHILPNRAADTAQSLLDAYGVNVEAPDSAGLAGRLGFEAGQDFVTSHLAQDNANQEQCYRTTVEVPLQDDPVELSSRESVLASKAKRRNLLRWADVRDGNVISRGRRFLTPHAFKWTRLGIDDGDALLPSSNPLPSPEEVDRQMEDLIRIQRNLETDPTRKVQVSLWADGPKSTLPPGHWQEIAIDLAARRKQYDLDTAVKLLLLTSVANYEAAIAAWHQKWLYLTVRPQEYIVLTRTDDVLENAYRGIYCKNGNVTGWKWRGYALPALNTPAFPEYPSGHSTFSMASATVLALFTGSEQVPGDEYVIRYEKGFVGFKNKFGWEPQCFSNSTTATGSPCTFRECAVDPSTDSSTVFAPQQSGFLGPFPNWTSLAEHAGESRLYGGYHPQFGNIGGLNLGRAVGEQVFQNLCARHIGDCSPGRRSSDAVTLGPAVVLLLFSALSLII